MAAAEGEHVRRKYGDRFAGVDELGAAAVFAGIGSEKRE
jgi:hypothetical protein